MNYLEELEKKYEELGKEIERFKNGKRPRWRARKEKNEEYYLIASDLEIGSIYDTYDDFDNNVYKIGNYFKTKTEAETMKEKILIYMQLKDLALRLNNGRKIDWNDGTQCKYFIFFDYLSNKLDTTALSLNQDIAGIYCLDNLFLDKAIEEIGKENLIKLFKEE